MRKAVILLSLAALLVTGCDEALNISCRRNRTQLVVRGTRLYRGQQVVKFACRRHPRRSKGTTKGDRIGTGKSRSYYCADDGYYVSAAWMSRRWVQAGCVSEDQASKALAGQSVEDVYRPPIELIE